MIATIVGQFGLAMIPRFLYWAMSCGLISGTTRGMSGSIRNAEELSTTTAPDSHAAGANSLLREAPAENRAMSIPLKALFWSSSTGICSPRNASLLPTERSDASRRMFFTGNFRSARICNITSPTAPVAPATATLKLLVLIASPLECVFPRCAAPRSCPFPDRPPDLFAHLLRPDTAYARAFAVDVPRAESVGKHALHGLLDQGGFGGQVKGIL